MKIALLGKGKTGSHVLELNKDCTVFDSKNNPTLEKLKGHDVVICFLAGDVYRNYLDLLVESAIPVVSGSTGFNYPENFSKLLSDNKLRWIHAHNFSLGMSVVQILIEKMGRAAELFDSCDYRIHEVHHTKKLDAPSGTALHWKDWLGREASITHERIGDVVGDHKLTLSTPLEEISLQHIAKDRSLFAKGAIWAAKKVLTDEVPLGLNQFSDITRRLL